MHMQRGHFCHPGQSQWEPPQAATVQQDNYDTEQVIWRLTGRRLCSGGNYKLHKSMVKLFLTAAEPNRSNIP